MSNTAITPDYVKSNGRAGKMGQTLIAIVAEGNRSRAYVAPTEAHETLALAAKPKWKPETSLPNDPRNFWTVDYGLTTFGDLFTDRQLVALNTFSDLVHEARAQIETDARIAGFASDLTPLRDGGKVQRLRRSPERVLWRLPSIDLLTEGRPSALGILRPRWRPFGIPSGANQFR
jgi:putative DNA methylase